MTKPLITNIHGYLNYQLTIRKSYAKTKGWKKGARLKYIKIAERRYKIVEGNDYLLQEKKRTDGRTYYRLTISPYIVQGEKLTSTTNITQIENNDGELEVRFTK